MDPNTPPQFETTYEWVIENFNMCPQNIDECLRSNTFYLDSIDLSEYQLILYPRGRLPETTERSLCLLECLKGSKFPINVTMYIAFEDELKKMETRGGMEKILMNTGGTILFELLPNKPPEPVIFALLPGELFTVRCTITLIHNPQTDESQLDTLSKDLERLYRSELFSDFCLISFGEHRFPVHKMMLTTRCPGLAKKMGIFDNESSIEGVLDHVTAEALDVILFYVYTGRLYEYVPEDVRNAIHSMVGEYDMDDFQRELFPPEICTGGRTTIQVDTHNFTWNLVDFGKKVKENVWPSETTIDLVIGQFVASFSVVRENDGKNMNAQIDLKCLKLMLDSSLTVKCVVQATVPLQEYSQFLCEGEYKFSPHNLEDICRLKGEIYSYYLYFRRHRSTPDFEDSLALVFNFSVSYHRDCEEETINTLDNIRPMWKRSLYRLSSDLYIAYSETFEDDKGSDMRVRLDGRPVLQGTYCSAPNGPFLLFAHEPGVGGDPGPAIPAHRCILSVRSDCLLSMINCDVRSELDNTCEIRMTCAPLKTVNNVLRYVYSGKLSDDIVLRDLVHIYIMSDRYKIKSLAKRCLQLIPLKVDLSDLKLLLHLSNERRDLELYKAVVSIIRNNRDSIKNTPEWAEIVNEIRDFASKVLDEVISG